MNNGAKNSIIAIFVMGILGLFHGVFCEEIHLPRIEGTQNFSYNPIYKNLPNASILNDEYEYYKINARHQKKLKEIINFNWVKPQKLTQGEHVVLLYKLSKKYGTVSDITIMKSSGSEEFDKSVIETLKKSSPLPSLPKNKNIKTGNYENVELIRSIFFYNDGELHNFSDELYYNAGLKFKILPENTPISPQIFEQITNSQFYLHKFWTIKGVNEEGFGIVEVPTDEYGNYGSPKLILSSGNSSFDKKIIEITKLLSNSKKISSNRTKSEQYTVQFLFSNYNNNPIKQKYGQQNPEALSNYVNKVSSYIHLKWDLVHNKRSLIDSKPKTCSVIFDIRKDGVFENPRIYISSGNADFDNFAIETVKKAKNYKPIPSEYNNERLTVVVVFEYKPNILKFDNYTP